MPAAGPLRKQELIHVLQMNDDKTTKTISFFSETDISLFFLYIPHIEERV